ncbi:MAG: sigma-70 family RNA polymerase sigma factor [Anaerolineae bacterium]|jgi:RNA polymerase sigma-70 factor (ECF subfamily)|nr:sigma-70 family RNA polymerase sigma factor [Anaerolineae bacterium]
MVKDEAILIQQALQGDLDAFNQLILTYQDAVYGVAYRLMGEGDSAADATQETFIAAFRRLETYRGGSFKAWLLRIATNTCYDELRRRQRRPLTGIDDLPGADSDDGAPLAADTATPEEAFQQSELQIALQDCINSLQEDQRLVLILSDVEGYSYQEIADHTNAQLGTVKSRLSRARLGMRRCLDAVRELLPAEFRLISDK